METNVYIVVNYDEEYTHRFHFRLIDSTKRELNQLGGNTQWKKLLLIRRGNYIIVNLSINSIFSKEIDDRLFTSRSNFAIKGKRVILHVEAQREMNNKWFKVLESFAVQFMEFIPSLFFEVIGVVTSDVHSDLFLFLLPFYLSSAISSIHISKERIEFYYSTSRFHVFNLGDYYAKDIISHNDKLIRTNRSKNTIRNIYSVILDISKYIYSTIDSTISSLIESLITYLSRKRNITFMLGNHDSRLLTNLPSVYSIIDNKKICLSKDLLPIHCLLAIPRREYFDLVHLQHGMINESTPQPILMKRQLNDIIIDTISNDFTDLDNLFIDGKFNRMDLLDQIENKLLSDLDLPFILSTNPNYMTYTIVFGHSLDYDRLLDDGSFDEHECIIRNRMSNYVKTNKGWILDNVLSIDIISNSLVNNKLNELLTRKFRDRITTDKFTYELELPGCNREEIEFEGITTIGGLIKRIPIHRLLFSLILLLMTIAIILLSIDKIRGD